MSVDCKTCGDPQSRHKGGKGGCRACEFGCGEFVPDEAVQPVVEPVPAEELAAVAEQILTESLADDTDLARPDPGPGTSIPAQMLALEQERDEAKADAESARHLLGRIEKAAGAEDLDPFTDLAEFVRGLGVQLAERTGERDSLLSANKRFADQLAEALGKVRAANQDGNQLANERDAARTELADVQAELKTAREEIAEQYLKLTALPQVADHLEGLLNRAEGTQRGLLLTTASQIRTLFDQLRGQLAEHDRLEGLRVELAELEARAAAIRAELGEEPPPPASDKTIREWAKKNGFDVPVRGVVPLGVRAAYLNAHPA